MTTDQYRNILRVSVYEEISEVSGIIECSNGLTDLEIISNIRFNGGVEVSAGISPGTGFDTNFKLVGERIDKRYTNGMEVDGHSMEWVSTSEWNDFSWKDGGTVGSVPTYVAQDSNSIEILSGLEGRLETRASLTDENEEDYRNRYIATLTKTVSNIASVSGLNSGIYFTTDMPCSVGGNVTEATLRLGDGFRGWMMTGWEILPHSSIGGKLCDIRRTFEGKADWALLNWSV